ncbi:integrase, catalytic region, zinc finger, CCHC-type containing protein [Tanacetum coccineum]|uniref:Integrase, catalytic region, zinc finger, CCHC-type containing protein n=1 Tax=Tanacetum coccineum TaxID=301880 RepID=A0ABQ5D4S9_9ASTR
MTTLAEFMIVAGADNRPPMLDKPQYESWKRQMERYIQDKDHGRIILNSVVNGPLVWPTVKQEDGTVRLKTYEELSDREKLQADCDLKATNIVLQGRSLLKQECECKLYDKFDKFSHVNGETLHQYYLRQGQNVVGLGSKRNASGSQGNTSGQVKVIKCYNCQGEGHMARQCTQPKRKRDATCFKEKVLLVQAQAEGKELDEEQLAFLADPGVTDDQVAQIITHNAAFQTDDLDAYDSDCDDISSTKAVLMANLSSCDSDVLSEVPYSDNFQNDMMNQKTQPEIVQNTNTSAQQNSKITSMFEQMSNHATSWDKANKESKIVNESLTIELERYEERVKILEKRVNVDLTCNTPKITMHRNTTWGATS